ncbi:Biopolymer transport protein ExbD/TolR [hydrothermal vent metagenome]|uniref:Biopolymer transport protein ExbD/TolR n=1 Tax=hydrothermal vent metagenome TaxID=652676 RepID=A0A3B1AJG4_9ZZZZ
MATENPSESRLTVKMNFRITREEEPQLNLTPLIDVVFLLLIFFMVSTTFDKQSELSIDLPAADGTPVKASKIFKLEIAIDGQGHYFVNQRRLKDDTLKTLKRAIRITKAEHKKIQVIISSDKNTPYQAFITAMDAAKQLGLEQVNLATKHSKD